MMNVKRAKKKPPRRRPRPDRDVEKILQQSYPSHREPLQIAWSWNRENDPAQQKKAFELLKGLKSKFSHVLKVRFELALALVKRNERKQALHELEMAGEEFPFLDEDTFCLWGRCYKDAGDEALEKRVFSDAVKYYGDAIEKYARAYSLPKKTIFPASIWRHSG